MLKLDSKIHTDVNGFLEDFFDNKIKQANKISPAYVRLWETTRHMVISGGKRLRPALTILAYEHSTLSVDRKLYNPDVISIACSHELLHSALLMHDDIIDRDTVRRGQPNVNGRYEIIYSGHAPQDDLEHYAHSASILAGDLLISGAHELINYSNWDQETKDSLRQLLEKSIFEVAGGELLDVEAAFMRDDTYDPEIICRYKTAGYSFIYPLLSGATMSGADKSVKSALTNFGEQLGIAYQLSDDILGVFGDEKQTGKSTTCDLREAKQTLIVKIFMETASARDKNIFNKAFGNKHAVSSELQAARDVLQVSGARRAVEDKIESYLLSARRELSRLSETPAKQSLKALTETLMQG